MTASTEGAAAAELGAVVRLTEADVDDAVALSASAHWNQNANDWRLMLRLGQAWGLRARLADGTQPLVASTLVLPYAPALGATASDHTGAAPDAPDAPDAAGAAGGRPFAWVSMVLVLPAFRRLGLATRLLREALAHLQAQGLLGVLDATPAGHEVYAHEGFRDTWGFARYRRPADMVAPASAPVLPAGVTLRALCDADWPAVAALDAPAFGADRLPLLRGLAQRLPQAAWVAAAADGGLCGFVLGRDGREANQIGPLWAADDALALALLQRALAALPAAAIYADLCDRRRGLLSALHGLGFEYQRPFTRMVYDPLAQGGLVAGDVAAPFNIMVSIPIHEPADTSTRAPLPAPAGAPGNPAPLVLVAGPELG